MKKLESGMQLEMNLEKGRLREESTNLSQRIKDTHNRIETEVQTDTSLVPLPSPYFLLDTDIQYIEPLIKVPPNKQHIILRSEERTFSILACLLCSD